MSQMPHAPTVTVNTIAFYYEWWVRKRAVCLVTDVYLRGLVATWLTLGACVADIAATP